MTEYKVLAKDLPFTCDNDSLGNFFSSCGEILSANIVYSRESGRSRGFGFVSFSSEEAMNKALKMDGLEMNGRKIQVLKKINRDDRDRRRDGGRRDRSRDGDYRRVRHYDDSNKLIVLQLPWKCTKDDLEKLFEKFGTIVHCNVLVNRETGRSRGMGIVKYETEEAYKKAMEEMNNFEYEGRKLTVRKFGSYSQDFIVCSFTSELLKVECVTRMCSTCPH